MICFVGKDGSDRVGDEVGALVADAVPIPLLFVVGWAVGFVVGTGVGTTYSISVPGTPAEQFAY
jgi:hypothetical protein